MQVLRVSDNPWTGSPSQGGYCVQRLQTGEYPPGQQGPRKVCYSLSPWPLFTSCLLNVREGGGREAEIHTESMRAPDAIIINLISPASIYTSLQGSDM